MTEVSNGAEQDPVAQRQDAEIGRILGDARFSNSEGGSSQAISILQAAKDIAGMYSLAAIDRTTDVETKESLEEQLDNQRSLLAKRSASNSDYDSAVKGFGALFRETASGGKEMEELARKIRQAARARGASATDFHYSEPPQPTQQ